MGDLDLIRELPYGPALKGASQAGQMAASDQASELRNPSCAEGGVHRWKADLRVPERMLFEHRFLLPL